MGSIIDKIIKKVGCAFDHALTDVCIFPVRFGLKLINDGTNKLYVVISQDKIKTDEVIAPQSSENSDAHGTRSSVDIRISRIFENVNSKDLIRYIPDNMLSEEQRKAKYEAISETENGRALLQISVYDKAEMRSRAFLCSQKERCGEPKGPPHREVKGVCAELTEPHSNCFCLADVFSRDQTVYAVSRIFINS